MTRELSRFRLPFMARFFAHLLAVPLLIMLAVVAPVLAQAATIEGTATYRERMALPREAVFQGILEEFAQPAQAVRELGRTVIDPAGSPPYHFQISYDPSAIQPGHRYAVSARIMWREGVLFRTTASRFVFNGSEAPLELMMMRVGDERPVAQLLRLPASYEREMPGANSLARWRVDLLPDGHYLLRQAYVDKPAPNRFDHIGRWQLDGQARQLELRRRGERSLYFTVEDDGAKLVQLDDQGKPLVSPAARPLQRLSAPEPIEAHVRLNGMFRYMADAASIVLCGDGWRLPVAMEGDFRALERAYTQANPQPGQPMLVDVDGIIASRPSMEESQPPRETVVVEHFIAVQSSETCPPPGGDVALRGTYWKLVSLDGKTVETAKRKQEPHLIFSADNQRVSGSSGCNRVTGSFEVDGDELRLRQMVGTMMACPIAAEQERAFLHALGKVERYRLRGGRLDMLDGAGHVVTSFEAVALR